MISNGRAGSSPAPSTKKTPRKTGVFAFLYLSDFVMEKEKKTKKQEIDPRFDPRFLWIEMAKKRYSSPKLFIPKKAGKPSVDSGVRWYVYFYWRTDPKGPLDKKFTFRKNINRLSTIKERKEAGEKLVSLYRAALERNWNPETKSTEKEKTKRGPSMTLQRALEYAYEVKTKSGKKSPTLIGYEFHKNRFLEWAKQEGYLGLDPKRFSIDLFYEFLDWLRFEYVNEKTGEPLSGGSVNNHKASLSALFTTMKNERLLDFNFIKDIPKVEAEVMNNKAFTIEDLKRLKAEMEETDPYLVPFFSFILYPLLRPREICRLQVKDIDIKSGYLSVETKTDALSVRRIIDKLKPTIQKMKLENEPGAFYLFTNKDQPADWEVPLKTKVDHFGKRFRKIKEKLGYGREYGLYSGRHTAILDLYNAMVAEGMGEQEILFKLMPITQHRSVAGIKNYLRKHKKSIPPDHSAIYTIDF